MHKKGVTEEVAKRRARKTVKYQRGIVGADLSVIAARRNQTASVRSQMRLTAIAKSKAEKKEKEKKAKVTHSFFLLSLGGPLTRASRHRRHILHMHHRIRNPGSRSKARKLEVDDFLFINIICIWFTFCTNSHPRASLCGQINF
jgi:hypothetical protein